MAKLTRCRIAGFSYDNGKSGYSDVIFDYTEENGRTPVNDIVYTIKNGIGKTVLLQAMLQPLKPNSTIAGRRFKEFFPKAKDKAFIALEYRKDNSNEFLTIGIAVRARSRSKAGADDEPVDDGIEYYSFITEYKDKDAPESISWLPFSRTEGNKVYISAYDCIEDMARKSGKIQIIKNDLDRLKSTLRDYGISPDEVDLMGKINQDEGGVQDYFDSKAKTSSQLVRNLMIPSIETAMKKGLSAQESNRDPICESFFEIAKSQSKRMEDAEKRAAVEQFMGPFAAFRGKVEMLVNAGERRAEASADYMSLAKQLGDYATSFEEEIGECKDELKNTEKEQDRLAHEEASYKYYTADDAYREADGEYKEAEGKRLDLDQKSRQYSHEKDVLVCAKKYASLCEAERERDAVLEMIKEKEKDTDSYEQLDRISYSIYAKASVLKEEVDEKLPAERDRRDREKEALKTAADEYTEKAKMLKDNKSAMDRKTGEYETHCKLSDSYAAKLPGDICRRLDGRYSRTEIKNADADTADKKIEIDKRITVLEVERVAKQNRQTAIPYEKESEYKKKKDFEAKITGIDDEIKQYNEIKEVASAIADEYGYSLTRTAEAGVTDAVNLDIYKHEAKKDALVGENILLKIEAAAVEKGSLHVSESALRFLDNEDAEYEVAESLILDMAASGRLEPAEAEAMLKMNPLLAYAVIVPSEKDRDKIITGSNGWVSSVVPVFTREELAAAFEGDQICVPNMLARFDKGYFHDPAAFANALEEKIQHKASEIEETNARIDDRTTALDSLFAFFDYGDSWLTEKLGEKAEIKNSIELCNKRLNELKHEEAACSTFLSESADKIKELETERSLIETSISAAKELLREMGIEDSLQKKIDALSIQCKELETSLDRLASETAEHETEYENARKSVIELEKTANICEEHINTVKWDREHELLEQPVEQLLKWREDILNKQEEDMQQLSNRFEVAKEKVALYENDLKHSAVNVAKDEYVAADTSEERWTQLTELMAETAEALFKAEETRDIAMQKRSDAGAALSVATDALSEWNKTPLSKSSIGTDFAKRKRAIKKKYKSVESSLRTAEKNKGKANNLIYRIKGDIADKDIDTSSAYILEDFSDAESVFNSLSRRYKEALAAYAEALRGAANCIRDLRSEHSSVSTIADYISQCEKSMPDTTSGLDEISSFGNAIRTAEERLNEWHSYLVNSLKDIEEEKERFISECARLARKYREGIDIIGKKTKVQLDENHTVRMLRIHLPDVGSEDEGRMRIAAELDKGIEECASELAGLNDLSELPATSKRRYEQVVSGFNLVTTYLGVGPEGIRIDAYKIAEDSSGGEYYRWEQKTRFSGGQRFALYLAVILALLNYARRSYSLDDFDDKLSFSLLLDNPFGTMSSAHLIKPVFSMARKLNAQLICLTDIRNAGVLNQFDVRYDLRREDKAAKKALIEARRYAGANMFTDIDTEIEEAHFKAEQLSLI